VLVVVDVVRLVCVRVMVTVKVRQGVYGGCEGSTIYTVLYYTFTL
jgi:hypothetical protein